MELSSLKIENIRIKKTMEEYGDQLAAKEAKVAELEEQVEALKQGKIFFKLQCEEFVNKLGVLKDCLNGVGMESTATDESWKTVGPLYARKMMTQDNSKRGEGNTGRGG